MGLMCVCVRVRVVIRFIHDTLFHTPFLFGFFGFLFVGWVHLTFWYEGHCILIE